MTLLAEFDSQWLTLSEERGERRRKGGERGREGSGRGVGAAEGQMGEEESTNGKGNDAQEHIALICHDRAEAR